VSCAEAYGPQAWHDEFTAIGIAGLKAHRCNPRLKAQSAPRAPELALCQIGGGFRTILDTKPDWGRYSVPARCRNGPRHPGFYVTGAWGRARRHRKQGSQPK